MRLISSIRRVTSPSLWPKPTRAASRSDLSVFDLGIVGHCNTRLLCGSLFCDVDCDATRRKRRSGSACYAVGRRWKKSSHFNGKRLLAEVYVANCNQRSTGIAGRFDNSGPGGRWFESTRPDQLNQYLTAKHRLRSIGPHGQAPQAFGITGPDGDRLLPSCHNKHGQSEGDK
jgi:hypothetical protein